MSSPRRGPKNVALGLEQRLGDVAQILAVRLERQRPVAADLEPSTPCPASTPGAAGERPAEQSEGETRRRCGRHPRGRDEVESSAAVREPDRQRAGVGVRSPAAETTTNAARP